MALTGRQILSIWAAGMLAVSGVSAVVLDPIGAWRTVERHAEAAATKPLPAGKGLYYLSNDALQANNVQRQTRATALGRTQAARRRIDLFLLISISAALSTLVVAALLAIVADSERGLVPQARRLSALARRGRRPPAATRKIADSGSPDAEGDATFVPSATDREIAR